jgi:hypothetical protein
MGMKEKKMEKLKCNWLCRSAFSLLLLLALLTGLTVGHAVASMKSPPPQVVDEIIIGDRVVDIAYNLGVLPKAMSVRGGMWSMATQLKTATQMLRCPYCIQQDKDIVPNACKKYQVKRLIIEKNSTYSLYRPDLHPEDVAKLMEGTGVKIEYVDFSDGLDSAIRQTASLLGQDEKAEALIADYHERLAAAQKKLPVEKVDKKVVIFSGTYQASTGKTMLRVEAAGGYSDQYMLDKLGSVNVGDVFKPKSGNMSMGHYVVNRTKKGLDLEPLLAANPDVIIATGDQFSVQKALADAVAANPELSQVSAIKNMQIYALPAYIDSSVIEYPGILQKWTVALAR